MKRLNVRLLVWLIVTPLVLAVCIHFLHAYQIDRNAGTLKAQAEEALKRGEKDEAIKQLSQYLKHRDEADSYQLLATLAADVAEMPEATRLQIFRAFQVMEEALRRHPELKDVRSRITDFCMKYGRFRDAIDHIDQLRALGHGKEPALDVKYAQCLLATGREEKANKLLAELVGFDAAKQEFVSGEIRGAKNIDGYMLLAEVYRRQSDDSKEAELLVARMVALNADDAKAYLERGRFRQRQRKFAEAEADLAKARELDPKNADIVIASAEAASALKKFDEATQLLERGKQDHPNDERIYRSLATLALQSGNPQDAMKIVDEGLEKAPQSQYLLLFRADLELQTGDVDSVRATVKQMREGGFLPELIDYIEGRILIADGKWLAASRQLERLRPLMARFPDLTVQIDMLLGQAYQNLGQPDRAMDAFRRALDADPLSVPAQLGYAQSMQSLGRQDEAAKALARLGSQFSSSENKVPAIVINNMLQMKIAEELRKPAADRDWKVVDALLARVLEAGTLTESQQAVLDAEIAIFKGDIKHARGVLSAAVRKFPKELPVWLGLVNLVRQDKESKYTTLEILDRAENELGPVLQLQQIRLAELVRDGGKSAKADVAKLEQAAEKLNERERVAFLADLGNAYYRMRDYENARRCWLEVVKFRPDDSKIYLTLFELAQEFGSEEDANSTLEEIRKVFGTGSALTKFCQAEKLVWQVKQKKAEPSTLDEARDLLDQARKSRPDWHEISRLHGEILELEGKADEAIVEFQRTLELGPPNPNVARRLVALLYLRGQIDQVDKALTSLGDLASADPLKKIEIERDMRQGNLDAALDEAAQVVAAEPENANSQLWYAQLLSRAGRDENAEAAFRKAVSNDPTLVQGWLMLVAHLVNAKKIVDAKSVIREAQGQIAEDVKDAFAAQAFEMVGDQKLAEEGFLALLKEKPNELANMRNLAAFYLRTNQLKQATQRLEEMLASSPAKDLNLADADRAHVFWARRALVQATAADGEYRHLRAAVKLLDGNRVDGQLLVEDKLLLAGLLAKRPEYASRLEALKLLEQVQTERQLTPEEQFVQAQLYEQTGDWGRARENVITVLSRVEGSLPLAVSFSQMLLKHDELVEAEQWIQKLETTQPNAPAVIELRARLLVKQGDVDQAAKSLVALVDRAPNENVRIQLIGVVSGLLEEFKQYDVAEELLRDAVIKYPRARIALGAFLGRHGDIEESFALFEEARKSYPLTTVVQAGLETLRARSSEATPEQFAKVEKWLQLAMEEDTNSLKLQLQQAELNELRGQSDEVISQYRQLLGKKDLSVVERAIVENNLAFVLGMTGSKANVEEALKLVNSSIEILGPSSDLLDTRAICYLKLGDNKRALEDLRAAVADVASPLKLMHLAMAEAKSGDKGSASKTLERSRKLGLDVNTLSPREKEHYHELALALES